MFGKLGNAQEMAEAHLASCRPNASHPPPGVLRVRPSVAGSHIFIMVAQKKRGGYEKACWPGT